MPIAYFIVAVKFRSKMVLQLKSNWQACPFLTNKIANKGFNYG